MTETSSLKTRSSPLGLSRKLGASALTLALFASQIGTAYAAIDNTATANGTSAAGGTLVPPTDTATVPVAAGTPALSVAKSVAAPVDVGADGVINAGDTITYTYVITNNGNVSITGVTPVDSGPTFAGETAGASLSGFTLVSTTEVASAGDTLLPGEQGTWTAVYTLTAVDAYRAAGKASDGLAGSVGGDAVLNSATATGSPATGTLAAVTPSVAEVAIPANPKLDIVKTFVFTTDTGTTNAADLNDVITYTYTVTNTGNVPISALAIADVHESVALVTPPGNETLTSDGPLASASPAVTSSDAATNGSYDLIQPGATVTFTYAHTVTQAEVDGG